MYKEYVKPLSDFILAIIGFLLLFPIFILVAICLVFANKGNPFFLQERPGKNGKIFKIIKFKTMADLKDSFGVLLPDSERITKIGAFIRKSSLDEIPQLLNVIKGEMSLIGPRPLLIEYLELYNQHQRRRHEVKPGITGWAQINGRNAISWDDKFNYDVWYVDNLSIAMDFKILLRTLVRVVKSEGISSSTSVTMHKFDGNK